MAERPPAPIDEFSYATAEDPRLRRLVIRAIERMTGQPHLKRLYEEYRREMRGNESFWATAIRKLQLKVHVNEDALAAVPHEGPLVIVANHPFGVLDGVVISYLTSRVRDDFLVLTNSVLYRAEEIRRYLLPVDFSETREALDTNLRSRAAAKLHLSKGGCLVVFPAGAAATAPKPWSRRAVDLEWKNLTARLIIQAKAPVVPIYFAGQNSRLFQIASHISMTFRLSLFFKEVHDKIGSDLYVRIGRVIPFSEIANMDRKPLMDYLRRETYALEKTLPER